MAGAADGPRGATGGREGEAATRPAPVLNTMSAKAGDDGPGDTVTVHGAHMGNMDEGGACDLKGDGWSTGLCEFMNPDATSLFDWGYVCTSCACPCLQFYLNWLIILKGAPVLRLALEHTSLRGQPMLAPGARQRIMPRTKRGVRARSASGCFPLSCTLCAAFDGRRRGTGGAILLLVRPLLHVWGPSACCL